jgi:hypothetical protein
MSRKRLLDSVGGRTQYLIEDNDRPDDIIIQTTYDVEREIEAAKLISELPPGNEFRHAAVIPPDVMDRSIREKWVRSDWKKWANNSDNRKFRTWAGRL